MNDPIHARQFLAEAAHCDPESIPDDVRIGRFAAWDSLAHLRLIMRIEEQIGRQLDPDETVRIESLADIAALMVTSAPPANN
jgi:acyl carrier protein